MPFIIHDRSQYESSKEVLYGIEHLQYNTLPKLMKLRNVFCTNYSSDEIQIRLKGGWLKVATYRPTWVRQRMWRHFPFIFLTTQLAKSCSVKTGIISFCYFYCQLCTSLERVIKCLILLFSTFFARDIIKWMESLASEVK